MVVTDKSDQPKTHSLKIVEQTIKKISIDLYAYLCIVLKQLYLMSTCVLIIIQSNIKLLIEYLIFDWIMMSTYEPIKYNHFKTISHLHYRFEISNEDRPFATTTSTTTATTTSSPLS